MRPGEAIRVITSNYPPKRYSILREALDLAMVCLKGRKRARWPKRDHA